MVVIKHLKAVGRFVSGHLKASQPKGKPQTTASPALQALTVAALALPGLMLPAASAAEEDEVDFQYSHYEEGQRDLYGAKSTLHPIEVDSVVGKARVSLSDRIKFAFNYVQDTWSGATPITIAPLAANSNHPIKQNTGSGKSIITGASPYLVNPNMLLTPRFVPIILDANGKIASRTTQAVDVLAMASPETRKQGDFKLGYQWDEAAVSIGGGLSVEPDYQSRFVNIGGHLDLNQKLTALDLGLSYTNSDTSAIMDHDAEPYITKTAFTQQIQHTGGLNIIHGNRQDWAGNLGLSQILNRNALVTANVGYTHSTGYMENPYKAMTIIFADPTTIGNDPSHPKAMIGDVRAFLEQRPDERNQFTAGGRYIQHIGFADAALHLDYRFFHDDWGINAHTFEADWVQPIASTWTVTPKIRYYTQDAANFYHPYLISKQAYYKTVQNSDGSFSAQYYDAKKLPSNFSSDQRLSAYGALSGGVTVNKKLSKAVSLEAGFEYYTHAGSLKLGGGGDGSYNDFNYYLVNGALNVNLEALGGGGGHDSSGGHDHHDGHHTQPPAGVMFGHMLKKTNDIMLGYRYMYSRQAGDMLHGTGVASDKQIQNHGCVQGFTGYCRVTPAYMDMGMHMLDIMYAPTDWLNLMVMPQFMDMDMDMRPLKGVTVNPIQDHLHGGHRTGGIGDTGMYALFKMFDNDTHHVHATLGLSAPTGDVDIMIRRMHRKDNGYLHYGMQLGSGTWDFKPSLTYTGQLDDWSWGGQFSTTTRMENHNSSGYALGDVFQTTAWGGYTLTRWLSASVRGIYTVQQQIDGGFNPVSGTDSLGNTVSNVNPGSKTNYSSGPMDYPTSYGGRYWDVGFGLNFTVPSGTLKGNHVGVEWLQPVQDNVNGYQLQREGAFSATWSVMF